MSGQKELVVVSTGNRDIQDSIHALETEGFHVTRLGSFSEAQGWVAAHPDTSVVWVDGTPFESIQFIQWTKANNIHAKTVCTFDFGNRDFAAKALNDGADHVVYSPLVRGEVTGVCKKAHAAWNYSRPSASAQVIDFPKMSVLPGNLSFSSDDNGGMGYAQIKKIWNEAFERQYLATLLEKHRGNVSKAARDAKVDRSNFLRLVRRNKVETKKFRQAA